MENLGLKTSTSTLCSSVLTIRWNVSRERDESLAMIAVAKTPVHVAECWKLHFSGYLDDLSEAGVSDELENLRCGSQI